MGEVVDFHEARDDAIMAGRVVCCYRLDRPATIVILPSVRVERVPARRRANLKATEESR